MNSFKLFLQAENLAAFKLVGGKITSLISYPSYFDSKIISNIAGMITFERANYKFNPNKPGIFQWQSVDDVFLMVVD
ncbi:hypothetical protein Lp900_03163 (plasmid) [Lactiplantibacillus plantarum]|nr:hypothetical protein Lp900_03163 [Lactiplantibacillus plantarum]